MIDLHAAKYHLRIDDDEQDDDILAKLRMADGIVRSYLANPETPTIIRLADYLTESETLTEPLSTGDAATEAAVLLILGELWLNREAQAMPLS